MSLVLNIMDIRSYLSRDSIFYHQVLDKRNHRMETFISQGHSLPNHLKVIDLGISTTGRQFRHLLLVTMFTHINPSSHLQCCKFQMCNLQEKYCTVQSYSLCIDAGLDCARCYFPKSCSNRNISGSLLHFFFSLNNFL